MLGGEGKLGAMQLAFKIVRKRSTRGRFFARFGPFRYVTEAKDGGDRSSALPRLFKLLVPRSLFESHKRT